MKDFDMIPGRNCNSRLDDLRIAFEQYECRIHLALSGSISRVFWSVHSGMLSTHRKPTFVCPGQLTSSNRQQFSSSRNHPGGCMLKVSSKQQTMSSLVCTTNPNTRSSYKQHSPLSKQRLTMKRSAKIRDFNFSLNASWQCSGILPI
jgi:hypothetical protein